MDLSSNDVETDDALQTFIGLQSASFEEGHEVRALEY
jgi:hypothetical protein